MYIKRASVKFLSNIIWAMKNHIYFGQSRKQWKWMRKLVKKTTNRCENSRGEKERKLILLKCCSWIQRMKRKEPKIPSKMECNCKFPGINWTEQTNTITINIRIILHYRKKQQLYPHFFSLIWWIRSSFSLKKKNLCVEFTTYEHILQTIF